MGKLRVPSSIYYFLCCILVLELGIITSIHSQKDEVTSLVNQQRYLEAVTKLENLVVSSKNVETRSRYYYQLGDIYYNYTQQYRKAIKAYEFILEMKAEGLALPEIYLAYIKIGDVYSRLGEYDKALELFNSLVYMTPKKHFVHNIGLRKIRDIQTALKNLQIQQDIIQNYKSTSLEVIALFQVAELYRTHSQLNQPERAIEVYLKLLKSHPTSKLAPEAQWRIAHLKHTVFNQKQLAIDSYQEVVDKFPTSNFAAEALYHIASIHRESEDYINALTVYTIIIDKYPNFWNTHAVYYWSGICYEMIQNYTEALNSFHVFVHVYLPTLDPVYLGQIGMYDKNSLEVSEILRVKIQHLKERIPKNDFENMEKAIGEGNYDEALDISRRLIVNAPNTEYANRAVAQLPSIKHRAAIQKLNAYINNDRLTDIEIVRTQLQIATIYERELLDYSKAIDLYRDITMKHPQSTYSAEAIYRMGLIYTNILEKPNSALRTFDTIIALHPNSLHAMMAHFQLGQIYHKLQRFDEALRAYKTTITYPERQLYLSGGYKDSFADRAQFRIGKVHFEDQRFSDARFAFEEFINNRDGSPRYAAAHIYLAVMYHDNGENGIAMDYYIKAENLVTNNTIQMQMVIDEVRILGLQNPDTVIQFLQDRQQRLTSN